MYTSESWEKYIYRPELVEKNWDQILKCRDLLADEASREYYMNSIQARMKRSPLNNASAGQTADKSFSH